MNYPTSDLGFAALLLTLGFTQGPTDLSDPKNIVFSIIVPSDDYEKVMLLHEDYKQDKVVVKARSYYKAQKDLKFLVKTANDNRRKSEGQK